MAQAELLTRQGLTQKEIAAEFGITDRTVRNWLHPKEKQLTEKRPGKLDPYKPIIQALLHDRQDYHALKCFEIIRAQGYTGGITILRDYIAQLRLEETRQVEVRFETQPGHQAQVDWKEFGRQTVDGREQKLYAFVMVLGYSRRPFVRFTTSMTQAVLLDCHRLAFEYYGGVPAEILYDNMKTAWNYTQDKGWQPNPRLLGLANHYGFIPRRCKVLRPKTKGKVERFIRYLGGSFWPGVRYEPLALDELDEAVIKWLAGVVGPKILRDFGVSRDDRFKTEVLKMGPLPAAPMDCRTISDVTVSRESFIALEGIRYSVPPQYVGCALTVRLDITRREAELFVGRQSLRQFKLAIPGTEKRVWLQDDREKVLEAWRKRNKPLNTPPIRRHQAQPDVVVCEPALYDRLLEGVRA
jgi:transposase